MLAMLENSGADFLDARTQSQAEARVRGSGRRVKRRWPNVIAPRRRHKMYAADFERVRRCGAKRAFATGVRSAQMRADMAAQDAAPPSFGLKVAEFELQQAQAFFTRGRGGGAEPLVIIRRWRAGYCAYSRRARAWFPLVSL